MGLYQAELSKQIFLRNKQKREWEAMTKKIAAANERKKDEKTEEQLRLEQEEREQNLNEINETQVSKKLCSAMVKSALERNNDTLERAVEVIQNQNGNLAADIPLYTSREQRSAACLLFSRPNIFFYFQT